MAGNQFGYESNLESILRKLEDAAYENIEDASKYVQAKIRKTLSGPRSGKRYYRHGLHYVDRIENEIKVSQKYWKSYKRFKKKDSVEIAERKALRSTMSYVARGGNKLSDKQKEARKYTASAPGEAPADVRRLLRNKIQYDINGNGADIHAKIGVKTEWNIVNDLEFGNSKVAPRPFIRPAFQKAQEKVKQIVGRRWLNK